VVVVVYIVLQVEYYLMPFVAAVVVAVIAVVAIKIKFLIIILFYLSNNYK
jgi:hypothetical protein